MPKQKGTKVKKRIKVASHHRGMRHEYSQLHSQYGGFHSKQVIRSVARSMIAERESQFLRHLATSLKEWYRQVSDASEIEIQIALIDEQRMLIASNKNETAEFLYQQEVHKSARSFLKQMKHAATVANQAALKSKALASERVARHSAKAVKEITGGRKLGLSLQHFEAEGRKICVMFDACDDIDAPFAEFVNGTTPDKYVAILTSSVAMHAEQKMLLALCKASNALQRSVPIIVSGTFRPCRGCYESLVVVQRYCLPNLQFGVRPGHYWKTTERGHAEITNLLIERGVISEAQAQSDFDKDGVLIGLTDTSYRADLRLRDGGSGEALHYGTDSDSDASDSGDA